MKKTLLSILLITLLLAGSLVVAIGFSPLPYLPLNKYLANSDVISGKISGSLNSGILIQDFSLSGRMGGKISIKEMRFVYSGLVDFYLKDKLVISEIVVEGVDVYLPLGYLDGWREVKNEIKSKTSLIPVLKNEDLSLIQIDQVLYTDINVVLGQFVPPPVPISPMALMGKGLPGPMFKTPGLEEPKKEKKPFPDVSLKNLEISNVRFSMPKAEEPTTLQKLGIEDFSVINKKVDLGKFECVGKLWDFLVEQVGRDDYTVTYDINGKIKKAGDKNLKKDVALIGRIISPESVKFSMFDNKVRLAGQFPSDLSPMPSFSLDILKLTWREYFQNIVPISKFEYHYDMSSMFSRSSSRPGSFFLGKSKFNIVSGPSIMGLRGKDGPIPLFSAEHNTWKKIQADVVGSKEFKQGGIQVRLKKIGSPRAKKRDLLSTIWFHKPYHRLKKKQKKFLKSMLPYFL